jgi:hypothetical protein
METIFLTTMIVSLLVVFTVDTTQKRQKFLNKGK